MRGFAPVGCSGGLRGRFRAGLAKRNSADRPSRRRQTLGPPGVPPVGRAGVRSPMPRGRRPRFHSDDDRLGTGVSAAVLATPSWRNSPAEFSSRPRLFAWEATRPCVGSKPPFQSRFAPRRPERSRTPSSPSSTALPRPSPSA